MKRLLARLARIRSPLWRGLVVGVLGSVAAAILYALVSPLLVVLIGSTTDTLGDIEAGTALLGSLALPILAAPLVLQLGVLPAVILGAIGGLLIGGVIALGRDRVTPSRGLLMGAVIGALLVGAVHLGLYRVLSGKSVTFFAYLFWLGVPSILAVIVAAWTGRFTAATQS